MGRCGLAPGQALGRLSVRAHAGLAEGLPGGTLRDARDAVSHCRQPRLQFQRVTTVEAPEIQ